jgi:hypothetical protein
MALLASARSGFDWRSTIAYVDQNGSEMERARLRGILGRARPDAKIVRQLEARQNTDGGFPYGMLPGRLSTIESTAAALGWMEDLGLLHSGLVERAVMYLLAAQRPDGSWDEPPGLVRYAPPPHLTPGDPRVRCLATARVGFWFARLGEPGGDAVARAAAYLRERQSPGGRFQGFLQTTWTAAAMFRLAEGAASEEALSAADALAMVEPERWYPGALTDMLNCLGDAGVSGTLSFIQSSLTRLVSLRQPDGSWLSEKGEAYQVEVTLRGLRAMLIYASVPLRLRAEAAAAESAAAAGVPV